jgi:hypothetical protein
MLCTFGVLGVMDFGHKKHKVGGEGGATCNIRKKMLHALGVLGLENSRF